ncbi:acyltransferase family protein [Actinoplanes sp. NPDC051861]|uniref:acyltransferase family protein n=1 Tax=Actinoplanes sp. NPDC051861 TaxID=3155170 RepID=UPI003424F6D1
MTVTLPLRRAGRAAPAARGPRHRADIEGLRAVAVLLVVLAHVGVPGLAGGFVGVDVFFVVSGFLITSLLRREWDTAGRLDLPRFYARRAVRLLPVATLVVAVTLAGAWLWGPPVRFPAYAGDALAAATYTVNLRLAGAGTDYFADGAPSPFQHFWSLAVEEQFYLVWPVLIVLLARSRRRWVPVAALAALSVASFAWSVSEVERAQPWAYFGSLSRAWELGAGALLALLTTHQWRSRPSLAWAGGAAILVAAVAFDDATPFPGVAALLPVLGTVAVIAAGGNRLLETAPMRWLGRMSYGWYLWHWPLLFWLPPGLGAATALLLAVASHRLLENPVRYHRAWARHPRRGLFLGLGLSAGAAALAGLGMLVPPTIPTGGAAPDPVAALTRSADPASEMKRLVTAAAGATRLPRNLTPRLTAAARQRLAPQRDNCHAGLSGPFRPDSDCVYGDRRGSRTVVLFGDSHALQWFPAFDQLARQRGWRLINWTRSSCSPATVALDERLAQRRYPECDTWRAEILRRVGGLRPDLVVVSSSVNYRRVLAGAPADPDGVWRTGWARTLGELKRGGRKVVLLGDTPFFAGEPADCLTGNPKAIGGCAAPADTVLTEPAWREIQRAAAVAAGVPVIDPVPWLCAARCPLVVGNTLVYRDSNHLTEAYARLLTPMLERRLG